MTIDNQSLQRRLNQVSKELERIYREKDDIKRNLDQTEGNVQHMNRLVNTKDNVDAQNIVLKDEVERFKLDNVELDRTLKNEEIERSQTGERLTNVTAEKKNLFLDKDNLQQDLKTKIINLDEVSRDKVMTQQKLNFVSNELELIGREELQVDHESQDLRQLIGRLQNEKNDLLRQLEDLTIEYDNCVRDITRDRAGMDD